MPVEVVPFLIPLLGAMVLGLALLVNLAGSRLISSWNRGAFILSSGIAASLSVFAAMMYVGVGSPTNAQVRNIAMSVPIPDRIDRFPGVDEAGKSVSASHPARTWGVEPGRVALVEVYASRGILTRRSLLLRDGENVVVCESDCGTELAQALAGS